MNYARHSASVIVLNGYIYVAGGIDAGKMLTSVELYDPNIDEWTKMTPMNKARAAFGLIESNGFLYAMGGTGTIEKFHPYKNVWTEVCKLDEPSMSELYSSTEIYFVFEFQIGSVDGSANITDAINIDGKLFAIWSTGQYARIDINESGKCSFALIAISKYKYKYLGRHFLYLV